MLNCRIGAHLKNGFSGICVIYLFSRTIFLEMVFSFLKIAKSTKIFFLIISFLDWLTTFIHHRQLVTFLHG